jgi:AcrR family transcriptional regulator
MAKTEAPHRLRIDAARNREDILCAAREAFAEQGTGVALEDIARRAGVGIATLYRRFPARVDLVAAAFEPKLQAYVAATEAAIAEPDPWEGFATYVRTVCAMQADDVGFADVLALTFPSSLDLDRRLRQATAGLGEVVERAKVAGALRPDFVMEDLVVLLMANAGVVNATKGHAPKAWERFATYMLDGFRAPGRSVLPPPINAGRLARAVRRRVQRR